MSVRHLGDVRRRVTRRQVEADVAQARFEQRDADGRVARPALIDALCGERY
jgi:hypothetical protein